MEKIDDSILLTGESAITIETDTTFIRYIFFSATTIDADRSTMDLKLLDYDDFDYTGETWNVEAALVECVNDPEGQTYAIRITVEKFRSETENPEYRQVHARGIIYTKSEGVNSPYDIWLRFKGCPISPSELGFALYYTTIEDTSNEVLTIESAITNNMNCFSAVPYEFIGNLIPETIGYNGTSSASVGLIEEFINQNIDDKILNVVAINSGDTRDSDYNEYDDGKYPSIAYNKCNGEPSDTDKRRINVYEIISLPCGFMSGVYENLPFEHKYEDHIGSLVFDSPVEIIGYHTFFFGQQFNCASTCPSPYSDEGKCISREVRYTDLEEKIERKLIPGVCNIDSENNRAEYVFNIASQIDTIRTGRYLRIIGNQAFKNLSNLISVDFEGSPLERIGMYAFDGCTSLGNPGQQLISSESDEYYESEQSADYTEYFDIPKTVKFIGEGAFKNSGIIQITIPEKIQYIESETFMNCSNLQTVNFDSSKQLKKISIYAFAGTNITELDFPSTLKNIEKRAFYNCSSIRSINIPDGVMCSSASFENGGNDASVYIGKGCTFGNLSFKDFNVKDLYFTAKNKSDMPKPSSNEWHPYPHGIISSRGDGLVNLYIDNNIWEYIKFGEEQEAGSFLQWLTNNWVKSDTGNVYAKNNKGEYKRVK